MSDRRPPSPVVLIAITLVVLLGAYVGAYYVMVRPVSWHRRQDDPSVTDFYWTPRSWTRNVHPKEWSWNRFFAPIHWIDRHIRPDIWN